MNNNLDGYVLANSQKEKNRKKRDRNRKFNNIEKQLNVKSNHIDIVDDNQLEPINQTISIPNLELRPTLSIPDDNLINGLLSSSEDTISELKDGGLEQTEYIEDNEDENEDEVVNIPSNVNNLYVPRDMSWIVFQQRLLALAKNKNIPLLERFKYLAITASNLDEFTTVRLSRLAASNSTAINGMTMEEEIKSINNSIELFLDDQNIVLKDLLQDLYEITGYKMITKNKELSDEDREFVKKYFNSKIKGLLTPIVADNSRPFPMISNKTMNIGVTLEDPLRANRLIFATIQMPDLPRVIEIKTTSNIKKFILLEDMIRLCIGKLFVGKRIDSVCQYRVLRNLYYNVGDEDAFIVDTMKETLKRREMGKIMRLDICGQKKETVKVLHKAFRLTKKEVNKSSAPIDLTFCSDIDKLDFDSDIKKSLVFSKFESPLSEEIIDDYNIFDQIDDSDIIIHHPYESYQTVVDFVRQASKDKHVMAIKQTLYRISDDSEIMKALIEAAERGKQVTVILEVKARFDEANNLKWAAALEKAGGHVIYGIDQFKIHCKMCLVVRKDKKGNLSNYVHVGTGNYNEKNAKMYTDLSLLTSKTVICNDIEKLFNALSGFSEPKFKKILVSPYNLSDNLVKLIDNEIEAVKAGKEAKIVIKVNGLTDKVIIDKLYEAAKANVNVTLIVRTACAIKPEFGIKIKAIIGRFLEHSRIYYFHNSENQFYIGSSDLMERNLYKRVELMVPITDSEIRSKVKQIIETYENDISMNSFELIERTEYDNTTNSQDIFMNKSLEENNLENINKLYISK